MAIQRKCPNCLTWNADESYCTSCGKALDPDLIREEKDKAKERLVSARPITNVDRLYENMRYSRWWIIRGLFWIGYSIWFVLFAIVSFFIALIAWTPG